jgi:hypothetical protein
MLGSGPVSERANGAGASRRRLLRRLRSPLARPVCGEGGPSCVMPVPPARPAAARLPHSSPWQRPARPLLWHQCLAPRRCALSHRVHPSLAQPPRRSASACTRGLNPSLPFAPDVYASPAPGSSPRASAPGSRHGLLPASGLLRYPRRHPCSPSALLAACKAVPLMRWRGGGVARGSGRWALADGRRGGTVPGGRTRPVEKAV